MRKTRQTGLAVLALALGGCQSMAISALKALDDPAFSMPVAAAALSPIPAAAEPGAIVPAAIETATPAEPVPPARTDIRGAGDGSMKVDRIVVTASVKEIPHKVADFSREQIASIVCQVRTRGDAKEDAKVLAKTKRAYEATVAAHDAREARDAGAITLKQVNAIEKKRQDAVGPVMGSSGGFLNLFNTRVKKDDLPPPSRGPIALEAVDLFTFTENGQEVMAVSGVVHNTGATPAEVAPLTLQALDAWEFILAGQTSLLPFEELAAGESKPFEMRFLNPPDTTYEVYAHFAPPFEYRARRDCDGFDPDTTSIDTLRRAETVEPSSAPIHTAAELNQLTRIYRNEAQSAWNCRTGRSDEERKGGVQFDTIGSGERREGFSISLSLGKGDPEAACAPAARRLRWREAFALAEATDEAWGAMRAAEIARARVTSGQATQADVDAADAAQAKTYAGFRKLGEKALARVGGSAPGVAVEITKAEFGHEKLQGRHVEFTGVMRNTGSEPRDVAALMLALVDRLEQPMMSITIDEAATLAPGETREFTHRIQIENPVRSAQGEPPVWQIRVGAMGK
jgi:hypothetical protein